MKKVWLILILMLIWPVREVAAQSKGYFLSPPFSEVEIGDKDKEVSFDLSIGNNSTESETFEMAVVDFGTLDESGGVAFLNSNQEKTGRKYALASWISLEKNIVVVESGKSEKIKVTIINKDSLQGGGHYGAVTATIKYDDKKMGVVGLNQMLASLIYVQKSGGEKKELKISRIEYDKNWWYIPSVFKIRFENSGNVHLVPRGKIEIGNIAKGIINEESGKILPESFRIFSVPMKMNKWWVWPGKYTISVNYRYDGKSDFVEKKEEIYYFGREGLIMLMVLATGIGVWLKWKS